MALVSNANGMRMERVGKEMMRVVGMWAGRDASRLLFMLL